ncbi:putative UDP-rhamnose:rhamnosyltransferase 1 [Hevea brasiliensis]|uniref:putative UDP-rhamnose:rhamnosyltransferase 1 n=1 Tax=Hevea brasiliensis TaxID=3981 RepID=UPI0025E94F36|nr:putative UDP-rhamnose:rhamnosyltransferase 1 [Hevea brasiliensis]
MAADLHVAILPWSAFGHIMPFFQFSIALAKAGVHVSFVSTPGNIQRLPKLSPSLTHVINLVELPMPTLDGECRLPEGAEATIDISSEKIQYLKVAYDLLQHPFKKFVAEKRPNWLVVDFCHYWAADIAKEFAIPLLYLSVFSGAMRAFIGPPEYLDGDGRKRFRATPESLTSPPEWITFPSSVAFRSYEARNFFSGFYGENASGVSDAERIAKTMSACQAAVVRSCTEFEGEYLKIFEKILGKPVIPLGLLPPEKPEKIEITDGTWRKTFEWLDNQEHKSVVFVGFGSECKLTKDQVYEIAYGLELSELPFLWALRKPSWAIEDFILPPGFSDRTSKKGIVCIGWAPQQEILAHPSIGGSLFHSGWGSIIETLQHGLCLIALPFIIDQGVNARLLVEKGLAVEVDRKDDGSFTRNDIDRSLRLAMVSEEGKQLRHQAKIAAAIFGDRKLHQNYITRFVEYLRNGV